MHSVRKHIGSRNDLPTGPHRKVPNRSSNNDLNPSDPLKSTKSKIRPFSYTLSEKRVVSTMIYSPDPSESCLIEVRVMIWTLRTPLKSTKSKIRPFSYFFEKNIGFSMIWILRTFLEGTKSKIRTLFVYFVRKHDDSHTPQRWLVEVPVMIWTLRTLLKVAQSKIRPFSYFCEKKICWLQ